ncbi:hypothetical protein Adt_37355 [Abeliophyllum distichum]|uniref:Uncharacterized protein n=1 Tax=Abeliophyllum distichum TaxID=126358 RepID=A0ABD1QNW2_9LAMI
MLEELPPCDSNDPCDIGCPDSFIPPLPFPFGTVISIPHPRRAFLAAAAVHEDTPLIFLRQPNTFLHPVSPSNSPQFLLSSKIKFPPPPLPSPSLSPFNIFYFSDLLLLASILLKVCNTFLFRHSSSVYTGNEEVLTRLVYVTAGVATVSLSSLTTEDHERSQNGNPSSESVVGPGLGSATIDVEEALASLVGNKRSRRFSPVRS